MYVHLNQCCCHSPGCLSQSSWGHGPARHETACWHQSLGHSSWRSLQLSQCCGYHSQCLQTVNAVKQQRSQYSASDYTANADMTEQHALCTKCLCSNSTVSCTVCGLQPSCDCAKCSRSGSTTLKRITGAVLDKPDHVMRSYHT